MQKAVKEPVVIVNFKAYSEASFDKAIRLAGICLDADKRFKGSIIPAPSIGDLALVKKNVGKASIFSQHADSVSYGSHTGHISIYYLKDIGVRGSLINHSERRINTDEIGRAVVMCKEEGIISCVCVPDIRMLKNIVRFAPDYIAYEPPELIGGDICVTNAKTGIIEKAVDIVRSKGVKTKVLCGAGIKSNEDLLMSLDLGCAGILIASGIVKAKDQKRALERLVGVKK